MNDSAQQPFRISLRGVFGLLTLAAVVCAIFAYLTGAISSARQAARRMQEANNLKNLALALHNYAAQNKQFPVAVVRDANGAPFKSWRVAIIPFIESHPFCDQYNHDQPWNSPANEALSHSIHWPIFQAPGITNSDPACTNFVMPVGPGTIGESAVTFADIKDGTSDTIFLLALKPSDILWYEPRDLDVSEITRAPGDPQRILIRGKLFQETLLRLR